MVKENNKTWIVILIIGVIFAIGASQGWFRNIITYSTINTETINKLNTPPTGTDCTLSLDKTSINLGDSIKGTIHDGSMTFCEVFSQKDGIWKKEFEGTTDINGDLSGSRVLVTAGTFFIKALCGKGTIKECVTNGVTLTVKGSGDSDGDGYPDQEEIDKGTDPNDPNDYPGHRVCGKIKSPAFQTACDVAVSCSSGYKCTFHMEGGIGGRRWCSCDKVAGADFCVGLNKGYISGREVDSCSYCNSINEICEFNTNNNKVYCCMRESFQIGCNDLDFTKSDFDNSLKTSTSCTDDTGTHVDSCSEGLLDEWYCTNDATAGCKHTYYNCENMLGAGYYCSGGECKFSQEIVACDIGCAGVTGAGSQSIPFSMIPKPYTCVDYPSTQCSKGVYNIGIALDSCCCFNCKT